jgi:hypothetical protein
VGNVLSNVTLLTFRPESTVTVEKEVAAITLNVAVSPSVLPVVKPGAVVNVPQLPVPFAVDQLSSVRPFHVPFAPSALFAQAIVAADTISKLALRLKLVARTIRPLRF